MSLQAYIFIKQAVFWSCVRVSKMITREYLWTNSDELFSIIDR